MQSRQIFYILNIQFYLKRIYPEKNSLRCWFWNILFLFIALYAFISFFQDLALHSSDINILEEGWDTSEEPKDREALRPLTLPRTLGLCSQISQALKWTTSFWNVTSLAELPLPSFFYSNTSPSPQDQAAFVSKAFALPRPATAT